MSLDVGLTRIEKLECSCGRVHEIEKEEVYWANITHNLALMAGAAGIYEALWRPHRLKEGYKIEESNHEAEYEFEKNDITYAKDIIELLKNGLKDLKARPDHFKQFDSENGWGVYDHFVPFVEQYLKACIDNPECIVNVSR